MFICFVCLVFVFEEFQCVYFSFRTVSDWIKMKFDSGTLSEANKQTLADLCAAQVDSPDFLASSLLTSAELDFTALKHSQGLAKLQTAKAYCAASSLPVISVHLAAEIDPAVGSALADLGRYTEAAATFQAALKRIESRFLLFIIQIVSPVHAIFIFQKLDPIPHPTVCCCGQRYGCSTLR